MSARGDTLWATLLYGALVNGCLMSLGKGSMRRNNKVARSLFKKNLLKQCVTMGADSYTKILMYEFTRDHLVRGTSVEKGFDCLNVTTNAKLDGKAQGPDERLEEVRHENNNFEFFLKCDVVAQAVQGMRDTISQIS